MKGRNHQIHEHRACLRFYSIIEINIIIVITETTETEAEFYCIKGIRPEDYLCQFSD